MGHLLDRTNSGMHTEHYMKLVKLQVLSWSELNYIIFIGIRVEQ